MKYKYYDKGDRLIAESDSPIQFNVARFPVWETIKPVVMEEEKKATVKVAKDESVKQPYKKKKKTEEDNN